MLVRKAVSPFTRFAHATSRLAGRPLVFALAVFFIVAWGIAGPYFDFSDAWQLTVNTATTIVTFLMVFLIQATQNRDAEAIQIKLDEIIRAIKGARNELLDAEEMEEEQLVRLRRNYVKLAEVARDTYGSGIHAEVPELEEKAGDTAPHILEREKRRRGEG